MLAMQWLPAKQNKNKHNAIGKDPDTLGSSSVLPRQQFSSKTLTIVVYILALIILLQA